MPILLVASSPESAFRCTVETPLCNVTELLQWQQIIAHVLEYIILGRRILLMTLTPQKWSLGYHLPEPRIVTVKRDEYLINTIPLCSEADLKIIVDSEELNRGLLLILPEFPNFGDESALMVSSVCLDFETRPNPKIELVGISDDGRTLNWLKPSLSVDKARENVRQIAEATQWSVEYES